LPALRTAADALTQRVPGAGPLDWIDFDSVQFESMNQYVDSHWQYSDIACMGMQFREGAPTVF